MYRGVTSTRSQGSSGSLTAFPVTRGQESPVFSGTLEEEDEEKKMMIGERQRQRDKERQKEGERERERKRHYNAKRNFPSL